MLRAHVAAVTALLSGDPNVRVYRSIVPSGATLPYAVLFPGTGGAEATAIDHLSTLRRFPFQMTYVGSTDEQVLALAERVEARLLDVTPAVAGRSTGPIHKTLDEPPPIQRDDDVNPPVLYLPEFWRFISVPA